MKICGIVCEYNPFHNGHAYHIKKAREITNCDLLICVMSGNFVQRGERAICDKWTRAETAILHGCDLVVELPFPFVVQRADRFAHGALHILKQTGIDSLVFGSESEELLKLQQYANQDIDYKPLQSGGLSFAKALELGLKQALPSNDMLGIFYLQEVRGTNIQAHCIKRTNTYHDLSIDCEISSATAIRKAFQEGIATAHTTPMEDSLFSPYDWNAYYPYIQTLLLTLQKKYLSSLFLMDEGIESLLIKQARCTTNWTDFITSCTSKRYTKSSIQRTLTHLLCQTTKVEINALEEPNYVRVLAFNQKGQAHLRKLQDDGIHVASTFHDIPISYRELELRATTAYAYPYNTEEREKYRKRELLPAVNIK